MKKENENSESVQGTPKKEDKRIQLPMSFIKELVEDIELYNQFIKVATEEPQEKAPMLIALAKRARKQLKLEV